MKHITFILFILVLLVTNGCERINSPIKDQDGHSKIELSASEEKLVATDNIFSFKILDAICQADTENENLFISPLSISMALGMALNGANGTTYEAMCETMELNGLTQVEINNAYKNIITLLTRHDPDVIFQMANSIWYADNFSVEQEFIDVNENFFNAVVSPLDFSDPTSVTIINDWVSENTHGRIEEIIEDIPPEIIMYLINAIYFNGTWTYEFDEEQTYQSIFYIDDTHEISTSFMVQTNDFLYANTDEFQEIDLPYGSGDFRMTILLPHPNINLDSVIAILNTEKWNDLLNAMSVQHGTIILPKIKISYEVRLRQALTALGMGIAFTGAADFTKINPGGGIFIDEVLHKSYLKVNEEGTEAAAVTCVSLGFGVDDIRFIMNVNRPYLLFIRETGSKVILFAGKITVPQWQE